MLLDAFIMDKNAVFSLPSHDHSISLTQKDFKQATC